MKKGLILFVALLVLAALPVLANAQGLLGFPWPGRAQAVGCGACDPCNLPLFEPPTFYVGWMETARNVTFSFDQGDPGSFFGDKHYWRVAGLWLGLEEIINLNCNCGIALDGWVLIPSNRPFESIQGTTRSIVTITGEDDDDGRRTVSVLQGIGNRDWNSRPDWWYLDAAATYAVYGGSRIIAGFRYEHFSTRFDNPSSLTLPSTSGDTADITVNSYLPYVGIQSSIGGPASNVKVRFIGFPYVPASVSHFETGEAGVGTRVETTGRFDRSYFLELFAEYSRKLFGDASMGAFFRWNLLHGNTNLTTDVLPISVSSSTLGSFDRNTYTFGGSLSLNFGSPF